MTTISQSAQARQSSKSMKAVRFHGTGDLRLDNVAVAEPRAGEVRIRPLAAGLCGTDQHILHGDFAAARPVTLGHEVAGVVDAIGEGVTGLKEGDLVSVQPNTYCGVCRYCRGGREHLCTRLRAYGVHLDGGFAHIMVAKASALYRLPPNIDPRIGCLTEPLACCVHGVDRANLRSGATVLVIGAGLIGLMLMRLVRLAGAGLIVVSEPQESRRVQALEFGADHVIDCTSNEGEGAASKATNGDGFDYVIDAVASRATVEQGVRLAARGASVLVFGVAAPSTLVNISPFEIYARELTISGSFINPYTHERAIHLLSQMQLERLRTSTYPLAQYEAAFRAQASGADTGKIVVLPQQ